MHIHYKRDRRFMVKKQQSPRWPGGQRSNHEIEGCQPPGMILWEGHCVLCSSYWSVWFRSKPVMFEHVPWFSELHCPSIDFFILLIAYVHGERSQSDPRHQFDRTLCYFCNFLQALKSSQSIYKRITFCSLYDFIWAPNFLIGITTTFCSSLSL